MKLKMFFGTNIPDAMAGARNALGEDVLIVSSHRLPDGTVKLVVAVEDKAEEAVIRHALNPTAVIAATDTPLHALFSRLHLPSDITNALLANTSAQIKFADILAKFFAFSPIAVSKTPRCFMICGTAGSGKTTAVIKLALAAKLKGLKPAILTLDTVKAGATAQLDAFCKLADVPLVRPPDTLNLNEVLNQTRRQYDFILIDTMAVNYLTANELNFLKHVKLKTAGTESILTLPAGLDLTESSDIAAAFSRAGCNRMIATKCDATKYPGNILYAAFKTGLPFAAFGTDASIATPFNDPSADELATLMTGKGK